MKDQLAQLEQLRARAHAKRSAEEALEKEFASLSDDQITLLLRDSSTPELDAFRAQLPGARTSELITILTNPDSLMPYLGIDEEALITVDTLKLLMAAGLALQAEIDARVPPRKI